MAYKRLQTMRYNIEAIRTAFRLGVEKRGPSAEEMEVLGRYAGFGGLKCILNDADSLMDAAKWSKSDIELFAPTVELRQLIREYSKDDREFARYMDSLKTSVLTAFYTPSPVVDAIFDTLKTNGVEVKKYLEPSAGQGVFVDSFMRDYPNAEAMAFEKDLLTGKILVALHPDSEVRVEGFEKIEPDYNGYFDVACSNIPFGDFAVADPIYATSKELAYRQSTKAIHNYFFLKALDSVREGGLVAFITSQGVMNSASPFVRAEMVKRADLVAALRLPNNTFSDNAGTDTGSDLIILQKHSGKTALSADEEFFVQSVVDRDSKAPTNKYFAAFPQNVICTDASVSTDPYGKPAFIYKHSSGVDGIARDIRLALDESLKLRLDKELYNSQGIKPPTPEPIYTAPKPKLTATQSKKISETPIMRQYTEMKKRHPDAILLFRVGDFYECMGEDAVKSSEILGITLTRRMNGKAGSIELAGFPHHALDTYLPKLVRAGQRVAICEQLEDPKQKQREEFKPTEIVTPQKAETKPAPEPEPTPAPVQSAPETTSAPTEPAKEIDTDGSPDYNDNPDPRLFAYNLFGELEPIGKPQRQPRQSAQPKNEDKPKPSERPKVEISPKVQSKFRQLTDKELELYGSLNWDDNPPINGFYETMMSIAHRQLAEREAARQAAEQKKQDAEVGIEITRTEGFAIPKPKVAASEDKLDMSPRPFSEDIQFFHKNGSMVVDNGQVGFLSEVKKYGALFTPLSIKPEQ